MSSALSSVQPLSRIGKPTGVSSQASSKSDKPSPSLSRWLSAQPFVSTVSPLGVAAQMSSGSLIPSPSVSEVRCSRLQPSVSTETPVGVEGQRSRLLLTPSLSSSSSDCAHPSELTGSFAGVFGHKVSKSLMTPSPSLSATSMRRQPIPLVPLSTPASVGQSSPSNPANWSPNPSPSVSNH